MRTRNIALAAALLMLAPPAFAQPASPATASGGDETAAMDCGGMMGGDGMMGGGMGRGMMGHMGHGMMGMGRGHGAGTGRHMAAFAAAELAYLKTELNITTAQEAKWQAFADAVRDHLKSMGGMGQMMKGASGETLHERLASRQRMMAAHQAAFAKTASALEALYAELTPEQKEIIDRMPIGPMGMPMGMR